MKYVTINRLKIVLGVLAICIAGHTEQVQAQALGSLFKSANQSFELKVEQGMDLKEALELLETRFNVVFLYRTDAVAGHKVSDSYDLPNNVEAALKILLEKQDLEFSYMNPKTYGIYAEGGEERPASPEELYIIQETVTGHVVDSQTGEALPGVNIIVEGTSTGTATDLEGRFELTVSSLDAVLIFSYIGYVQQEIALEGGNEINVQLQQEAITGDEVVVVGYGQQRRRDITSSIASVSAEDIANEPVQQVAQSLQGRVSGVQVMQDSGNPGSSFMIRIRGVGSVNDRANTPLYVIDGNPMADPTDISPSQIENIQILKSASAAAIYGARGANGVVLITTKQGRPGDVQLDFNAYQGVQYGRRMPMANASEYAMLYNEAVTTAGDPPIFENPQSFGEGTDWQDELLRPASTRDIQLSVSGGNERSTYFLSGSYYMQQGVVKTTEYDRINLRLNSSHQINSFLRLGQNLSVSRSEFSQIDPYGMGGTINTALGLDPTVPVKNGDGSWGELPRGGNIAAALQRAEDSGNGTERPVLNGDAFVELSPLESLTFRSQFNISYGSSRTTNFTPEYFISTVDQNEQSSISRSQASWNNWTWENTLTYAETIGAHNFEGMVGVTGQENTLEQFSAAANDLPPNAAIFEGLRYLDLADTGQNVGGSGSSFGMISYLGRVNYNYAETYLATVNYRIDGSSRFGRNNRYGYFPSFSVGWRLSNEGFLEDAHFINDFMIRGGWGALGNQESLSNYAFTSSVRIGLDYYFGESPEWHPGQASTGLGNPNLRWESLKETNIGFDFTGFENRINVTFDYYNRVTSDMLIQVPTISYSGIQDPAFQNAGEVVNRGYEISVGYQRTTPGDFYYNISANMSYNHNELTQLAEGTSEILGGWISFIGENYTTRAVVDQQLGVFYGYKTDGLFQTQQEVDAHADQPGAAPGDLKFQDLNGDGVIDSDDQTYIGNPWPSYSFGFNTSFAYKNFDLNMTFQGVLGNDIFAAWKWYYYGGNWFNYHEDALGRWTGEGTSNSMPRLNINDPNSNLRNSDWYVEDGSYLRMNNLQIGYTFPPQAVNLRKLRIYVTATNLFTITNYSGVDPELGTSSGVSFNAPLFVGIDSGHYAVPRTFTFGINIGL